MKRLFVTLVLALAAAGAAQAGNWASVAMTSAPPAGMEAGKTWIAKFSVLQHGLASQPVDGLKPTLTIRKGNKARTFAGLPTGRAGQYRARVVFPSGGTWSYAVYDGFTWYGNPQTHKVGTIRVDAAASGGFPTWPVVTSVLCAAGLTAALLMLRRVRVRPQPAVQP
jgi:hypothetical protein